MYSPAARHFCIPMPPPPPPAPSRPHPRPLDHQKFPPKEILWRQAWPHAFTLILSSIMSVLTVIIIALEVASLNIDRSNQLSSTASTGAGIWCSISFVTAIVFMYLLVLSFDNSRRWATFTLVAHMIALFFILILIGLDANTVTPYNHLISSAPTKIQLLKGQLAMAVLLIVCPLSFLAAYIYTAFQSLYPFRAHAQSVHSPYPFPKY